MEIEMINTIDTGISIVIDTREQALYEILIGMNLEIPISLKMLEIGDIIIQENGIDTIIIERKTISDLNASITDGRYNEQSVRLGTANIHKHNIYYLLEGKIDSRAKNIYSAMFSLSYYKGFSIIRSMTKTESAIIISSMALKMKKEYKKRIPFYTITEANITSHIEKYKPSLIQKKKSDNITPNNFFSIVLCQIPSISSTTAYAITSIFEKMEDLIVKLKENSNCLDNITYTINNKTRRISKTSIANIKKFLL